MSYILQHRTGKLGIALLLAAALSACGGDSTPADASSSQTVGQSTADPCTLLTQAEIEAATGIVPGEPVDATQGPVPACNWPTADGSDMAFLTVLLAPSDNYGNFDTAMAKWKESAADMGFEFEGDEYQEVEGVGDFGAWLAEAGMLQVHAGGDMVQIAARVADGRDQLDAARQLAGHALARLR